ncbi:hypothetical protein Bpfe_007799, partial [Biomphalaria pfeifferi]
VIIANAKMIAKIMYLSSLLTILGLLRPVSGDIFAAVSNNCKNQASSCIANSTAVKALVDNQNYCEALKYSSSSFDSKTCLVTNGNCLISEYNNVKDSVCSATSVMAGMTTLFFCILVYMLN